MRIVNVLPDPRHYSYASTASGGRTLKPGETGPELDLSVIHTKALWKDIASGNVQIILSAEDKVLMAKYLEEGSREIVYKKRKVQPKPQARKKPAAAAKKQHTSPKSTPEPKPKKKAKPVTEEALKAGTVSLADLNNNNDLVGVPDLNGNKTSMKDIQAHMGGMV